MITDERLKELIKEKATIYYIVKTSFIAGVSNFVEVEELNLTENHKILNSDKEYICLYGDTGYRIKLENIFETKEDAEFALRYKRIPKTEYLDLPTWEEFKKLGEFTFYGFHQGKIKMFYSISDDNIKIDTGIDWYVFSKKYNKENYIKACRLCKKLFLGEEI